MPGPLLALLAMGLLSGCASYRESLDLKPAQWEAELVRRGLDPKSVPAPMLVTPEIRELANRAGGGGIPKEQLRRLQLLLMDPTVFKFEYEALTTYSAAETLERRRGNCVSFTNLFIALGRSLGIPLQAALLVRRGESSKKGDLVVVYGHLVAILRDDRSTVNVTVFDFYQKREETRGGVMPVDDMGVAAISASNWSVQALREGDLERAKGHAETAVRLAPYLPDVWANLGLVRWRMKDHEGAFAAFRAGLQVDSQRPSLLVNLAGLYSEMGKPEDARAALAAANHGFASPYFLIAYGDIEFARGKVRDALSLYRRAHRRDPKIPEPLLAIAKAEEALGNAKAALKAREKAERLAPAGGPGESVSQNL